MLFKLKPFNWKKEFNFLEIRNGFDAILGNPPYVRIQNIIKFSAEEIKFFQSDVSGYTVAEAETFDKYYLFIQRAINLLNENGVLGYIIPHKFFIVKGGKALRAFITSNSCLYSKSYILELLRFFQIAALTQQFLFWTKGRENKFSSNV